jgi:hypothetical protein
MVIAPLPPPTVVPLTVTVGVPAVVPMIPVVVFVRLPVIVMFELMFSVVPLPTLILLFTVFVPPFVKVTVPVPEVVRLCSVIVPVVPPPILPVPVIVTVGVPADVPMIPVVVFARSPAIDMLELIFSVVPAPTDTSSFTVFVPAPEKLVVPLPEVSRSQNVIAPLPLPSVPPPVMVTVPVVPEQAITPVVVFVKLPAEFIFCPETVKVPALPTVIELLVVIVEAAVWLPFTAKA